MWCNRMKRIISVAVSIGIILITLLGIFNFNFSSQETTLATNGELDLHLWNFEKNATLKLDGEWEFYPNELIIPEEGHNQFLAYQDTMQIVDVPGSWNEYLSDHKMSKGVGTYRLVVHLPSDGIYGLKTNKIHYANRLFMNGQLAGSSGTPSKRSDEYEPNLQMYSSTASSQQRQMEIVFHVANDNYPTGGIVNSVDFGTAKGIERIRDRNRTADAILITGYLALGLFYIGSFLRRKKDLYFLFFSFLCFILGVYLSMLNERLIDLVIPNLSLALLTNMQLSLIHFAVLFFLWFIHMFFKEYSNRNTVMIISVLVGIDAIQYVLPQIRAIFPGDMAIFTRQILVVVILGIACIYVVAILIKAFVKKKMESEYILVIVTTILCYGLLITVELLFNVPIGQLPVFLFFIMMYCLSLLMGERTQKAYEYVDQLSKDLIIQDRLKDEFLAKTSLQLGTPLQSILQISQSLMEGTSSPLRLKQHEDVLLINNVSTRLVNIVSDLMDASKVKQGELNIQPIPTKVTVIKSVLDEMSILIPSSKRLEIINQIPDDLPLIYVDEQRLKQIVFNIINNSIYYTEEGEITVSAHVVGETIKVVVADTGIGIPAEDLDRIFSSFFQVENRFNEKSTGLGLGLTISKQLVELSGGEITVTSRVGEGTICTFSLPLATPDQLKDTQNTALPIQDFKPIKEQEQKLSLPIEVKGDREYTILVVDHNHNDLKELIDLVHSVEYNVIGIDYGKPALEIIDRESVDLLIIDPRLPDISVHEICRVIREKYHMIELPILIISATGQVMALDKLLRMDVNGFLRKPVSSEDIIAKIESLLAMKKSSEEALHDELSFFYAQITPHFLYNTFNAIIGLSYKDTEKAREALQHLAVYFRAKLDFYNRDAIIPLKKEIDLVKAYVKIEKIRYGDKLNIQFNVDENIAAEIPTLTLQPLVENAVQHGIMKRKSGGTLHISIQKEAEGVEVIIEDNGVGMTMERRDEILHEKSKGIGVINSIKRLKLIKHTKFSLESEEGVGTKITIFLPGVKNCESSNY